MPKCLHFMQNEKALSLAKRVAKKIQRESGNLNGSKSVRSWLKKILDITCRDCKCRSHLIVCLSCEKCCFYCKSHFMKHSESSRHFLGLDLDMKCLYCRACQDYSRIDGNYKRSALEIAGVEKFATKRNCFGLKGMFNLGNTCFMNSVVQSFFHIPFIKSYFLRNSHNKSNCSFHNSQDSCLLCEAEDLFSLVAYTLIASFIMATQSPLCQISFFTLLGWVSRILPVMINKMPMNSSLDY